MNTIDAIGTHPKTVNPYTSLVYGSLSMTEKEIREMRGRAGKGEIEYIFTTATKEASHAQTMLEQGSIKEGIRVPPLA